MDSDLPPSGDHRPPAPLRRVHLIAAAIVLTLLATYGSFVPLVFQAVDWATAVDRFTRTPLPSLGSFIRRDFANNVLVFLPLGFCWLGAVDLDRKRRGLTWAALPLIAAGLLLLSAMIEFFQQWALGRNASHYDVLAEFLGGLLGMALWLLCGRWLMGQVRGLLAQPPPVATREQQADAMIARWRQLLQLYALALMLILTQPFDLVWTLTELKRKFELGGVSLVPFTTLPARPFDAIWHVGSGMVLFLPIGFLLRLGRDQPRSLWRATLLALLAAVVIEGVQLLVYSRFVDTTDVLIAAAGGFVGALLAGAALTAHRQPNQKPWTTSHRVRFALALAIPYTIALCVYNWQPFWFVTTLDEFWLRLRYAIKPPFSSHFFGSEYQALSKTLRDAMHFVPLGLLLRWVSNARHGAHSGSWRVVVMALLVGSFIEIGQATTINRHADITSIMLNVIGALLGWWLWGLLGKKPEVKSLRSEGAAEAT